MFNYSLCTIADVLQAQIIGNQNHVISQFSIDSRTVSAFDSTLFFAIKGTHNDAHHFIPEIVKKNVTCFVVSDYNNLLSQQYPQCSFIVVENSLEAFQKICAYHRSQFSIPVVGITGSNGKTICKEWLFHLLSADYLCVRSPKSYNSQVGVPLSVSLLNEGSELAFFEAGISFVHEMEKLQPIIAPTVGLFTNIGNAHQENFESLEQKIIEKSKLFVDCQFLIYCCDNLLVSRILNQNNARKKIAWSYNSGEYVANITIVSNVTQIRLSYSSIEYSFSIPFCDSASIENAIQCFYVIAALEKISLPLLKRFSTLPSVEMRLEQIQGENNCIVINDSYNSDIESVTIALDFLNQQFQYDKKTAIISDIEQSGIAPDQLYAALYKQIQTKGIKRLLGIGNDISEYFRNNPRENVTCCESTDEFLNIINRFNFSDEAILLKGARRYTFEKISRLLEYKTHRTRLEINLNSIVGNLNYFKSYLNKSTKVMAMVKGFSYGNGTHEIASLLQHNRVDYLGVAFVDEGIELRNAGISIPIVVLNPEPLGFAKMIQNNLEPEIYSFKILNEFIQVAAHKAKHPVKIHLKFDTGMSRMGFNGGDIDKIIDILNQNNCVVIGSVFSHLAGSDGAEFDDFTREQLTIFSSIVSLFRQHIEYSFIAHILNSAGIERFHQYQFDMVRLGIGLYGISVNNSPKVQSISTLKATISQIKTFDAQTTIGYSRKWKLSRTSKVAVISIGYADGLDRRFSNGVGHVYIGGKLVPIIGNVCMDATMIDVTEVACREGDEVSIFGKEQTITELANQIGTIPYEILTNISQRVKRIYFSD